MTACPYAVDLDRLDALVAEVAATEERLHQLASTVTAEAGRLHCAWTGQAAAAHAVAQSAWDSGFDDLRLALTDLRSAARTAHDNYTAAVGANLAMWEQVR